MNARKRPASTEDDETEGAKCNSTLDLGNLKRPLIDEPSLERPACSSQQYFVETASTILKLKKLDKQVLKMIAKGHHTLSIVEEPEFRKLVKNVSRFRGYRLQTRRSLTNELLPNVCREILENVKSKIRSSLAVCLTTDSWTSTTNVCYVTVTAHYIESENTELKSYLIGCSEIKDGFSDDGLYNFFKNIMLEFDIWNKVSAIVSDDNVVNIAAVVRQGPWSEISCFAQALQRILHTSLEEVGDIIGKTRKIVDYLHNSSAGLEIIKEIEQQMGITITQLKPEMEKHGCDTYQMLESIINIKHILLAKLALQCPQLLLSPEEWEYLAEILHILKPFYEVIQEICAENNVMLSKASVLSNLLQSFIAKCFSRHSKVTTVITKIKNEMNSYDFGDYENNYLYAESILLDPRFKRNGFRSNSAYETAVEKLRNRINSIRLNMDNQIRTSSAEQGNSIWHDFDQDVYKNFRAEDNVAAAKLEFDNYLEEEYLERKNDPLIWWNKRKNIYPRLYQYALKRLCNLATSVPSEQIFSSTAQTIRDRRMHLEPEEVSSLVFLHHNM
ncbi:Zinc finger BED domain-containing protein 4 [Lucilia cuprina]|nr:Zinc finger BED domain-containing protein 4 [Lucilia cuprina]